jgi:hypothetical protein
MSAKSIRQHSMAAMCIVLLVSFHARGDESVMQAESGRIARELDTCPLWTNVPEGDIETRRQISAIYAQLAQYETATIRMGIASYLQSYTNPPGYKYYEANDKVYALLRVVFKISQIPASRARRSISPYFDGSDPLWPFSIDDLGRLQLTGVEGPRSGPASNTLASFDEMASRLERRFPVSVEIKD